MRAWVVAGKYPIYDGDGVVTHTEIVISSTTSGYATFTERVLGDQTNKTDRELVELARDALFKSEFSDRAMAESVQKIDEMETVVKAAKRFMSEAETKMTTMAQSQTALESRLSEAEADRNTRFSAMEAKIDQAVADLDAKVDETVAELTEMVAGTLSALPSMEEIPNEESTN